MNYLTRIEGRGSVRNEHRVANQLRAFPGLRSPLLGKYFGAILREFEAKLPTAGHAAAGNLWRGKLPAARGLQSQIGKKSAWAGRIQFGLRDISRRVHL